MKRTLIALSMFGLVMVTSSPVFAKNASNTNLPSKVVSFSYSTLLAGVDNNISADMINKEIDSLIEEVGLKSARNKKYKKYSLGMKQRLGIAAAVLGNPDIVVLDEPTNALDDDGKDMVKRIVKMQKERGALVIISCHEMQTLEELSDEIVRLKEGRICE